jgi:hypothetical protein
MRQGCSGARLSPGRYYALSWRRLTRSRHLQPIHSLTPKNSVAVTSAPEFMLFTMEFRRESLILTAQNPRSDRTFWLSDGMSRKRDLIFSFARSLQRYGQSLTLTIWSSLEMDPNLIAFSGLRPSSGLTIEFGFLATFPELVRDEIDGILVPSGDVAALAAAILRIARDVEFRHRAGAAGRLRASQFDWSVIAELYESIYRDVLQDSAVCQTVLSE